MEPTCTSKFADYSVVAAEYYDAKAHPTCHDFFVLSSIYIRSELERLSANARILEVGAGASIAAQVLHDAGRDLSTLEITDASAAMLNHSTRWSKHGANVRIADAETLPHANGSVDCVVASLADPYDTPSFWNSLKRVLKPYGNAIVTLPSYEWAKRFRNPKDPYSLKTAEFHLRDRSIARLQSFVRPLSHEIRMIEHARFVVTKFRSLGIDDLLGPHSPKLDVFDAQFSSIIWGLTATRLNRN